MRANTICLILTLLLAGCKPSEQSNVKAIIGAMLIDGNGGPPVSDSVVIVSEGRIRSAGPRASVGIPAGSEKLDAKGLFLTPGLIDLHVHLGARAGPKFNPAEYTRDRVEKNLNAYLYYGVTTVRSVGTERDAGFEVRKAQRGGALLGARLFTAGRGFTSKGGHPAQEIGEIARQTDDPEDARRQVAELAAQQVDLIKIWVDEGPTMPKIKRPVIEAICEEARKYKIPVIAHIATQDDTKHLVKAGVAGFLHMIRDTEDIDPDFIGTLRKLRLVFAPTLVRQELGWLLAEKPAILDDPDIARTMDADVVAAIRQAAAVQKRSGEGLNGFEIARRNSRKLASAGVLIGVGSDGGSGSDIPGAMTHRELEILAEGGFSPVEVLTAATKNGAIALNKLDDFGTIEPGKRADLLLVKANPLEDVSNFRKIERIMLDGRWVDRQALRVK